MPTREFWWVAAGVIFTALLAVISHWVVHSSGGTTFVIVVLSTIGVLLLRIGADLLNPKNPAMENLRESLKGLEGITSGILRELDEIKKALSYLTERAVPQPEIVHDMKAALDRAAGMQRDAKNHICAVWAAVPYGDELRSYYEETTSIGVPTRRLINITTISVNDIVDHMQRSWEALWSGKYQVFFTTALTYEMLIVDGEEAAYFHFPAYSFACSFIRHDERLFVNGVQAEWDAVRGDSTPFIPRNFSRDFDESAICNWLNQLKEHLTKREDKQ